jgi:hypothetical protein
MIIADYELEITKKAVMVYFKALPRHLSLGPEEIHENPQSV